MPDLASEKTIRAAIFDVLDTQGWVFGAIFLEGGVYLPEDVDTEQRVKFVDAVIKRIKELQNHGL